MSTTLAPASAPTAVPSEPTTPIRPSEALRLGRLLRPVRIKGKLLDSANGACALGAMAVGAGLVLSDNNDYGPIQDRWPSLEGFGPHPEENSPGQLLNIIWDLNDSFSWPSSRIADWLESLGL